MSLTICGATGLSFVLYLHHVLPLPRTSSGNVNWGLPHTDIMKSHHSYTTPRTAKGKNWGSLFFFCLVMVVTGEQEDGNLHNMVDISSSFLPLRLLPLTPRELELHSLTGTSEKTYKHIATFFLICL